ncbi:TetR/AcrR family transcriptional regulator [Leptospira selangorensis]|uniref:TetR/AcrR family transcriptional regulator n=1 Tax=Leptospira selangorensis TaxID=2484982 RepID=A0A4R9GBQ7_9LEPT|nr:TetR/AcrR family transcriptional regulator [Leptospira selangorensis]TGK09144.1 TetR/AcrR family transcriptional regulator [Leptospira selangorensis]TGM15875.1 TetR/AcrR family transcriptional regulator [Leptospira selangorensis]TGM18176.1 TetR/AcrR family transcriptional regulator [Leptospira selangorensis]
MRIQKDLIRSEDPAKDRILKAAFKLFYSKGYPNTGINEILEEAGAFKKSLYIHFPSKKDLGKAYLLEQEEAILGFVKRIAKREKKYSDFIKSWMKMLRRGLKNTYVYGCPYANLSNQTHDEPEISDFVKVALNRWVQDFENCLKEITWNSKKAKTESELKEISESILFYYQGALQLYGMSGDFKHIHRLEKALLSLDK